MYAMASWVLETPSKVVHVDNLDQTLILEAEALASLPTTHFNNVRVVNFIALKSSF